MSLKDIKFYKKRVVALCKNLLKGSIPPNNEVKRIHDEYVKSIILYFKMQDTNDIIQQDYINFKTVESNQIFRGFKVDTPFSFNSTRRILCLETIFPFTPLPLI